MTYQEDAAAVAAVTTTVDAAIPTAFGAETADVDV